MRTTPPRTGRQLAAARALAGGHSRATGRASGPPRQQHPRQTSITTGYSSERVAEALADVGVIFFTLPTCGIRLKPAHGEEFRD
jgi:hypothetical protein